MSEKNRWVEELPVGAEFVYVTGPVDDLEVFFSFMSPMIYVRTEEGVDGFTASAPYQRTSFRVDDFKEYESFAPYVTEAP